MSEIEDLERGPDPEEVLKQDLGEVGDESLQGANARLANSISQKFRALPGNSSDKCTIFRVPEKVRKGKPDLFTPAVVSIGPYHHGQPHLRAMEERKLPLLQDFIRQSVTGISLEACIAEIRALEAQARRCYSESIEMDSDSFVEMMLLDSSFILLRLFKFKTQPETEAHYEDAGWGAGMISQDLILMENQIPFFILLRMHNYLFGQSMDGLFIEMIPNYLTNPYVSTNIPLPPPPKEIHHLLHLCHYYIVPPSQQHHKTNEPTFPTSDPIWSSCALPCATELQEAGIKIRKKKAPCDFTGVSVKIQSDVLAIRKKKAKCDFTDVSFKFQSGVLEIPFLHIADDTTTIIMNLVALEQCPSLKLPKIMSTYCCFFMDGIVNTANDVRILQHRGIIDNMLSGEEEMANFFNLSGQQVLLEDGHYLAGLFQEINKYCRGSKKHRYRAKLMRDYFSNPWSMFSLGATIFLLLLTFTQTFYTVFAYHRPPY